MVASRRFAPRRLIVRLSYSAFAFACAIMLAGCDLLVTILPQGGANAAFAYADPRLEKSVRIKGLNEVFNIAVAPDGRVFAIARDGVAEYTADLKHVRTYLINDPEGIDNSEDGYGPQEWQVTSGPNSIPVLYATRRGIVLYLFDSGSSIYQRKLFEFLPYSAVPDSIPIDFTGPFIYQQTMIDGVPGLAVLGFILTPQTVFGVVELSYEYVGSGLRSIQSNFVQFLDPTTLSIISNQPIIVPNVNDSYSMQRLYVTPWKVTLVMGQESYIGDVRSSTFIYDRALGGEPIARFDMRGAITAASDTALYAITSDHDESGGWIHKLRFRP